MEGNGMAGGVIPGLGGGMLGLDMSLHHHPHQQPQMIPFASSEHHPQQPPPQQQQQQQKGQHGYGLPYGAAKGKAANLSDEEEQVFGDEAVAAGDGSGKRVSPWQRMKWTDSMVRLLIMVVYYVGGDDGGGGGGGGGGEGGGAAEKKKGGGGGGGGGLMLQKKGKWKSVSRAMMEKGFYVSPQQCEDKFNDLNKRYKRVNDILGKGTACRVVENQSLLDTFDHISPKTKDEVRKLLNSKHLFFREMCAYHSTCAHNAASSGAGAAPDSSSLLVQHQHQHQHQHPAQRCAHDAAPKGDKASGVHYDEDEGDDVAGAEDEEEDDDEDEEEEEEEEEYDDGEEEYTERGGGQEEKAGGVRKRLGKRRRSPLERESSSSPSPMGQLRNELMRVAEDGSKSLWEQREWIRKRAVELEEQRTGYLSEALELEKQRFKWLKFSGKKERELEKLKLDNERRRLENDRMVLLLRHKDLELDLRSKRPEPTSLTGAT
ncbi:hypothetical protein H6P81_007913 [Aristolochia fimbriata]|uniref:Myb/SANT-like DNA-binding domain-containing protein n=1 Tax=Aristolochia fimbriata TaxID=158543 RepID=A0AAV7F282_ARIFI|nr:hypothetical protein H6P81_007913 [Aristolochia fimbriata]